MARLYDFTFDNSQWNISGLEKNMLYLNNIQTGYSYSLGCDVSGLLQLTDTTFLMQRIITDKKRQITKIRIVGTDFVTEFRQSFKRFTFLSEDSILFDSTSVYSISKNSNLKEFEWLKGLKLLVLHSKTDINKTIIFASASVNPTNNEYVEIVVDGKTLKPISDAYSTIRGSFVTLSDSYNFNDLIVEDTKYCEVIDSYYAYLHKKYRKEGKEKLLSFFPDYK